MKPYDLKQYIIEHEKIKLILEWLGCTNIKPHKKEFRCALPDGDDCNAVCIKKNTLKTIVYSKSSEMSGDILTLTMDIKKLIFPQALRELHRILGLEFTNTMTLKVTEKKDILEIFKKAKRKHSDFSYEEIKIYNNDICDEFVCIPYIDWVREGIMPYTQKEFGIGYNRLRNRVCIPWRFWGGNTNQYTGIVGRTLDENYKELGIPKYFPLIAFPKSMNIYGLQENYKHIQEAGYVIVFESEKSVLKCHSLGIKNTVAIGGHSLSEEHVKILISLDVTLIFAMDKDMEEELSIEMCDKVKIFRKTGYIHDEYGLLGEKDSCIDRGIKIFRVLLNRTLYIE